MRFRWLGNACIEVIGQRHLLIDPNFVSPPQAGVDLILITHEHEDHFRDQAKELGAPMWAPRSAAEAFELDATLVEPGYKAENIEVVPSFCYKSEESVGYLIHDDVTLLHPGDAFRSPEVKTDIVFVPIFADYHREILEAIRTCQARSAYPTHYDPDEKAEIAQELVEKIRAQRVEASVLPQGEWIEQP